MNEMFTFVEKNTYNLRSGTHLSRVNVHSTQYCTEFIGNLAATIQNLVPAHIKDLKTLNTFKHQIKKWISKDCPCRLCKAYVAQFGFLQELLRLFSSFSGIQYCLFYYFLFYLFLFSFYYSIYVFYVFFIAIHVFIYFIILFYSFIYFYQNLFNNNCYKIKKYYICVYVFMLCIC